MRIDELKKIANENGYGYAKSFGEHNLLSKDNLNRITVDEHHTNMIFIRNTICRENDMNMIKAAIKFAETSPEDREKEKKFYLKHKYFQDHLGSKQYFCIRISGGYPILKGYPITNADKFEFTLQEIEEIKEKFGTDLADFELVEVEE